MSDGKKFFFEFSLSMITKINPYQTLPQTYSFNRISFKQNIPQTLTHTNIGSCLEGYIGKVRVREGNKDVLLNVFKKFKCDKVENYTIQNDRGDIVGTVDLTIRKCPMLSWMRTDPSHVYVDGLRNFSNPNTPYYKDGLPHYKDIGTRLLQIAQRRSDESLCNGELKLISVNEALNWYLDKIGMRQEFPPVPGRLRINNPNLLYLPPENKEALSRLHGGL